MESSFEKGGVFNNIPPPPLPPPNRVFDDWGNSWPDSKEGWKARAEYLSHPWWVRLFMPFRLPSHTVVGEWPVPSGGEFVSPISKDTVSRLLFPKAKVFALKRRCINNIKRGVYVFKPVKR